jgi:hypothetical protein
MSDQLQISGTIRQIGETATFGAKGFTKREFLLETADGKFPQQLKFELHKDNAAKLDKFRVNQEVTVGFNIRGSEYNGKHYVSLVAWKIDSIGGQPAPAQRAQQPRQSAQVPVGGEAEGETYPF